MINDISMFGLTFGVFIIGGILIFLLAICAVVLKGYALWHAARRDDKGWFIALLIVNTLGILELIYLYYVAGVWKKAPPKATPLAPTPTAPNVPPSAQ